MTSSKPSNYNPEAISSYFDEFGIQEWNRLIETPVDEVSLYIHTHYLKKFVPAGSRVLEIGAGAGRFTQALAEIGAQVFVADISQVQLDLNKQFASQKGFAHAVERWQQIDICAMEQLESDSFDCVVVYGGPFSYVLDERDKALAECMRVLKPKGLILLSVMSLWGSAHRHLNGVLSMPVEINRRVTDTGDISQETFPERESYMHMFRAGELRDWLLQHNLTIVGMSASNFLSLGWENLLEDIRSDSEKWEELLRMELEACAEKGSLNMGTHMLAVVQS